MYHVMKKFMGHWSIISGTNTIVDKEHLKKIFDEIDIDGNGTITLQEYKETMEINPGLFQWFDILNNNAKLKKKEQYDTAPAGEAAH